MENSFIKSIGSKVFYFGWSIWARLLSDEAYVKWLYKRYRKTKLDLEHPLLFQEKLQWIKLYDRKPIYHQMVDKIEAKKLVAEKVGTEYCIPTLGEYDRFEDIDFDKLPNAFVLKSTFDSCSYYICTNKSKMKSKKEIKRRLYTHWGYDYSLWSREWPYKGLKHRIIAEPLLVDNDAPYLRDFKFYCFNGEPKIFYITSDKGGDLDTKQDFFDIQGNHIEIQDAHYPNNPVKCPDLPKNLDKMVEFCRIFAKDTYHLRVDFYEVNGKLLCGEFTFFENGGFCEFAPEKYNRILGDWIKLPTDKE